MIGQEHVLRALSNALASGRVHHAFLFAGTRGVGKTTVARILAKCLNCECGVSAEPCRECASCREIEAGRSVDLIEVDAASRTKVDDTRELLDNVQYAPTRSRFKIYLIDEVHMLSAHSFNALLKTLEEPPPHVKFLLATTDPQKLPVTVLSRCLQFNLKRLSVPLIAARLAHILDAEQLAFEPAALQLLAQAADGSMRDALSLLDQLLAFGNGDAREADARAMLGTVARDHVERMAADAGGRRRRRGAGRGSGAGGILARLRRSCSNSWRRCWSAWRCSSWCPTTRAMSYYAAVAAAELAAAISPRGRAAVLSDRDSGATRSGAGARSAHRFSHDADPHAGVPSRTARRSCRPPPRVPQRAAGAWRRRLHRAGPPPARRARIGTRCSRRSIWMGQPASWRSTARSWRGRRDCCA